MEAHGSSSSRSRSQSKSAICQQSGPDRTAGRASSLLANLPSRGLLSSTVLSSNLGGIRVYVCDHDTSPPEEQLIKTNTTNILIRALQINKQKSDAKDAASKGNKGKRSAGRSLESRTPAKRANTGGASSSTRLYFGISLCLVFKSSFVFVGVLSSWTNRSYYQLHWVPDHVYIPLIYIFGLLYYSIFRSKNYFSDLEGSSSRFSEKTLQAMTVERLRGLLKERGLSPKGKKDELVSRLRDEGT
ncbi:uncharacterized protein M6B38_205065 [Iris pallida]|uniref:SAP domain-containing protein n=1 Tax=Iris pallida TaxID=29817 RepID=A0AAX6E864_IRIPA|nr:uncharacterized protein M6B38_205065 [Iris pallida]